MAASDIEIRGAREHNLRDVDLVLPRNQLICLTGVSGSGKSSLAFDTLYAEGQRRYVESLSSFARQFLGQMPKPDVDHISGLSPSISIAQKSSGQNPRSTVGTITEIYDYLRVLFARVGQGHCPSCGRPITAQSREQILARIESLPKGRKYAILAPLIKAQKGEHRDLFTDLLKQGFVRARVDGDVVSLSDDLNLDRQMRHTIEVVVDRLAAGSTTRNRLAEAVELALKLGGGNLIVSLEPDGGGGRRPTSEEAEGDDVRLPAEASEDLHLSAHYACTHCDKSFEAPSPQLFSFNSPQGMCPRCDGLGEVYSFDPELLVTDAEQSFKQGAIELIGPWRDMGRWRRHIYQGVAETLERVGDLEPGSILETPWNELDPKLQHALLWGTGDLHITYTWRNGANGHKYGGKYEGVIPELLSKHRSTKSGMQRRALEKYMSVVGCVDCEGARLNPQARAVRVTTSHESFGERRSRTLPEVCALAVSDAVAFFSALELDKTGQIIAGEVLKEIRGRLGFLLDVGLDYLTLHRAAPTLSGGESQRIRLAGQIGSGLVGVLYILDEPSIGLHPRDNQRLIDTLTRLRDMGNTVVVVEHDEDTMRAADHVIDFGPGPGVRGGEVVAKGSPEEVAANDRSLTGQYLAGNLEIAIPTERRQPGEKRLRILGAEHNNLKNVDAEIPLGTFVCVTGVSGSGKSSLVNDVLSEVLRRDLNGGEGEPGKFRAIEGIEHLDKLIAIDQSPIGRTPRSNPATYIKLLDDIRDLYTKLPDSKTRGYKPGRFSFNVAGGRCEACEGNGANKLEMDFLADIWVTCPVCEGKRFNRETLQVLYKGKSIADVLDMDIQQALAHFENIPDVRRKLQTLHDVGLDYLKLGQPSPTLSGGEAQRVKLARELVKKSTGKTLYLLDEPTTGLHFADIRLLLEVLQGFVAAGNTVLVVEHNLDVIKTADWIVDLGPEGGAGGGRIIATGTPEEVAAVKESHTGRALAPLLKPRAPVAKSTQKTKNGSKRRENLLARSIEVQGARQHNLKGVDVSIPRDQMTVCCGLSGSGKSSLAMDTVYAEGQRRYVESLSSYARQFVSQMQKPQLDHISGLSPAIAIEQKNMGNTPRSTVGTVTEIYDYLRVLFARLGEPRCPDCDLPIGTQTSDEITDKILAHEPGTKLFLLAPIEIAVGEKYEPLWEELRGKGYARVRIDSETHSLDSPPTIDRRRKHKVEVVVDRIVVKPESRRRIAESVENALAVGRGVMNVAYPDDQLPEAKWRQEIHSQHFACDSCGRSFEPLTPHAFSFNSSLGWCPSCQGLGVQMGTNVAALVSAQRTLAEGAIDLWPNLSRDMSQAMLAALSAQTGIPLDVPFGELPARQRRLLLHGTGEEWFAVWPNGKPAAGKSPVFRFQFKGLFPALEEASRLSPSLRYTLENLVDEVECTTCEGSRLRDDAGAVRFRDRTIDDLCRLPLGRLLHFFDTLKLSATERKIAGELTREILNRLRFLVDVGLEYLTVARPAPTLSGGEAQRIRLASQVGSGLTGVLYVLDEPTIGLHPRDNQRLLNALYKLRDLGNTLLLVEHDREVVAGADHLLDFGPGAGYLGGEIVARGTPEEVAKRKGSVTGPYLSGTKAVPVPTDRRMAPPAPTNGKPAKKGTKATAAAQRTRKSATAPPLIAAEGEFIPPGGAWLEVLGARHHNLKNVDLRIPLGTLTAVTGVSGSGKSSLVDDVLYQALARVLHRSITTPGAHEGIRGLEHINKVIRVDQQPLGNTPTSNPATYTGVFDLIRNLFAQLPDAKLRGYTSRRFSFNVPGGRCETCEGNGQLRVEMHFLPDIWIECDTCRGQRYNPETLAIRYRGQSIADVLSLTCREAAELFENIPKIRRVLETLCDVGLDYLQLGQAAPTLSGGESQRVKLAAELARPDTGRTLYLLDEPTTGLHFDDLVKLLDVLNRLVELGNTVVAVEHNLDVIKTADWIIDVGPEAGEGGGQIVVAGTPERVAEHAKQAAASSGKRASKSKASKSRAGAGKELLLTSHTGLALAPVLEAGPHRPRQQYDFAAAEAQRQGDVDINHVGRDVKMPWEADGRRWHTVDRVARNGAPCKWDGRILARLVDRVHEISDFSPTDWNSRTVVEVAGEQKNDGWFLHALTGDPWLLELKFRVAKNAFRREDLVARLELKPLNELPDLPVYGHEPRVKCKNLRGPWQEIRMRVHTLDEIDRPAFWTFVEEAVASFAKLATKAQQNPEDVMPWKVLGQKWHFSRKGFPPGKQVQWELEVLEDLCEMLSEAASEGQFLWNNQQVVHLRVPGQDEPWASIYTKRRAAVELVLTGPKDRFALGRVAEMGCEREFSSERPDKDVIKIRFREVEDLARGDLADFLREHLDELGAKV
ncbi:MAG: excinuclease ABC subunit UvrA [Pirellulales bacterium]|nr:excinuclease ABC subunit UvrA [Pirellulales bacterium]